MNDHNHKIHRAFPDLPPFMDQNRKSTQLEFQTINSMHRATSHRDRFESTFGVFLLFPMG